MNKSSSFYSKNSTLINYVLLFGFVVYLIYKVKDIFPSTAGLGNIFGEGSNDAVVTGTITKPPNCFSYTYWKTVNSNLLTQTKLASDCDTIKNSVWQLIPNTDFDAIMGVAKTWQNQAMVSQVSDYFYRLTGTDLLVYLRGWSLYGLTDSQMVEFITYCKGLPIY